MRIKFRGIATSFLLLSLLFAATTYANPSPETLARDAASEDVGKAGRAIADLRAMGPAGLDVLFKVHAKEISEQVANPLLAATPEWQRLSKALDEVSQQKDSYLSRLYWHTDYEKAKSAARAGGKPILSLRLLGKLSEEYSCANSRFFRTILYSNADVSTRLREKFILHWQSVRPAPRVTIDFGDGRKLERTLTGNSIHYVLDSEGRPFDALPGLYGPGAFLRALDRIENFQRSVASRASKMVPGLPVYPRMRLNAINAAWVADTERIGGKIPEGFAVIRDTEGAPQALEIASLARVKAVSEVSILKSMTASSDALGTVTDEAAWNKIAQLHLADAQLDARSLGLIRRQTSKALTPNPGGTDDKIFNALVNKLQRNIALDTVRNEYLMRTKLYAWLISDPSRNDLDALNRKVYAELFLTPASDPWLGLFAPEVYTALDGGGIRR